MSTSATEDQITRAREIGLPTNVEEAALPLESRWYTRDGHVPRQISVGPNSNSSPNYLWSPDLGDVPKRCVFATEKEAINEARQFALGAETTWRNVIEILDKRYDAIEDQEIAQEKRRINDPD